MKSYYLHDGHSQTGPFSIDDLKLQGIKQETSIWAEPMTNWAKAGTLEELQGLFTKSPPPFANKSLTDYQYYKKSASNSSRFLKLTGVIALIIVISIGYASIKGHVNGNSHTGHYLSESYAREKTPAELREELRIKERTSPAAYIKSEGTWRKNLLGTTILEGTVTNTASIAKFKDVVLEVNWLTKTHTIIKTSTYIAYEFVAPGKSMPFKFKTEAPPGTKACSISVRDAISVD